jgi:GT2 family glycosyltransferase
MPEISVIIVNWNSKEFVRQCLRSLQQHCPTTSFEVIVVDGASFDGCGQMLAKEFPEVRFVQSQENLGFGRCNNLGAQQARGQALLFLNPDTELLEDSLAVLLSRLRSLPQAGAVGCKLLNKDRSLQTSCVQSFPTVLNQVIDSHFLRSRFPRWHLWGMQALYQGHDEPAEVEVISGACMMIDRMVFEKVAGFSDEFFMFGEDLDLCFKIRNAGFKVYCAPETSIVHHGGGSTRQYSGNFSNVSMRDSVHRFLRRHRGAATATVYRAAMALNAATRLILALPLLLTPGHGVVRHGAGSLRKWFSILQWGLGNPAPRPTTSATRPSAEVARTVNAPLPQS